MQFWFNDPSILLNKNYILELWPSDSMCYDQKMNAISRLIIVASILGFAATMSLRIIVFGLITLGIIYFLWSKKVGQKEGFTASQTDRSGKLMGYGGIEPFESSTPDAIGKPVEPAASGASDSVANATNSAQPAAVSAATVNPVTLESVLKENFYETNKKNPLSNVLLTEIMDDPLRKSAPPSFNMDVSDDITTATKKTVQYLNPGIKNTNKQLFGSMTDEFYLDQSNRNFFSTANTKIPNDQGAYADFLYGDMPSCRDGDGIECVKDNYRYILI